MAISGPLWVGAGSRRRRRANVRFLAADPPRPRLSVDRLQRVERLRCTGDVRVAFKDLSEIAAPLNDEGIEIAYFVGDDDWPQFINGIGPSMTNRPTNGRTSAPPLVS